LMRRLTASPCPPFASLSILLFLFAVRPAFRFAVRPAFRFVVRPTFRFIVRPSFRFIVRLARTRQRVRHPALQPAMFKKQPNPPKTSTYHQNLWGVSPKLRGAFEGECPHQIEVNLLTGISPIGTLETLVTMPKRNARKFLLCHRSPEHIDATIKLHFNPCHYEVYRLLYL